MADSNAVKIISAIAGIATIVNVAIWQYFQYNIEKQKHELQTILESVNLREKLDQIFSKIIKLTEEYQDVLAKQADQNAHFGTLNSKQKVILLNIELDQLIDDYSVVEVKLAKIENRQPRKINLHFRPPGTPTGIRLEQ